jgi:hypothetical protein
MNKAVHVCANCGSKVGPFIWHEGRWWCPDACIIRKRKRP